MSFLFLLPLSDVHVTECTWQNYFRDTWNIFDFITVIGSITEIILTDSKVGERLTRSPYLSWILE